MNRIAFNIELTRNLESSSVAIDPKKIESSSVANKEYHQVLLAADPICMPQLNTQKVTCLS